jgi:SnoaL-like domain
MGKEKPFDRSPRLTLRGSLAPHAKSARTTYKAGVELSPRPYIHNHVIELTGPSRATGRCYVELRDASDNLNWLGTGYYDDEYVKLGATWKFQSRRAQILHLEPKMKAGISRLQEK